MTQFKASNGVPIHDVIMFFIGDQPAQQFEGGTQVGGISKCGTCGCKDKLMDDQAHALNCKTRSLQTCMRLQLEASWERFLA